MALYGRDAAPYIGTCHAKRPIMRNETQRTIDEIKQALVLLRRHL
jgi:hypothetical protein